MPLEYQREEWREENVLDFSSCCADFSHQKSYLLSTTDAVSSTDVKILVTGASADRRYITLLHDIASGKMLGPNTNVTLVCFGSKKSTPILQDMANELKDCVLRKLKEVVVSSDEKEAFSGIHIAIMLDSWNNDRLTTIDKYAETFKIFKEYGQLFNYSGSNVKILVASEPAYMNAHILRRNCTAVQANNITSLSFIVINATKYQIAIKMDARPDWIKNIIVWGDEPSKLAYDLSHGLIKFLNEDDVINNQLDRACKTSSGIRRDPESSICHLPKDTKMIAKISALLAVGDSWKHLPSVLANDHWIKNYLPKLVKHRLDKMTERGATNFLALSKSICEQMHHWWFGVQDGEIIRMGVESDGSYGITKGLYADFPVTIGTSGVYSIVGDLEINPTTQISLQALNEKLLMDIQTIQNWAIFQQCQLIV